MKYVDEFRNQKLIKVIARKIQQIAPQKPINVMEVCGTHTHNFFRFGLRKFIPPQLRLVSGPGCPVCVSSQEYIDTAIEYARIKGVVTVSFGDMLNVPGTRSSLEKERAQGRDIRIVYSPWDTIKIARDNLAKRVVFLAVGFETTAPTIALTIMRAKKEGLRNLLFFSSLKRIPPAMGCLLKDKRLKLNGFLCPGHVSTIIGSKAYDFIPRQYRIGCCIAGFEPLDILEGMYFLMRQIIDKKPRIDNQYKRAVRARGNLQAQKIIGEVFKITDARWRGLGTIPGSGLQIRKDFSCFDAQAELPLQHELRTTNYELRQCKCGDVLKGLIQPTQCSMFGKTCIPDNPLGPCMVSSEGTCNAYFRYC